jgi:hypothetical protein
MAMSFRWRPLMLSLHMLRANVVGGDAGPVAIELSTKLISYILSKQRNRLN